MEYVVYILYSREFDQIYIGYTGDLISRYRSHNFFATKGWTIRYRPWEVIYCVFFSSKAEAMSYEKQLKGSRARAEIRMQLQGSYRSVGFISV